MLSLAAQAMRAGHQVKTSTGRPLQLTLRTDFNPVPVNAQPLLPAPLPPDAHAW